MNLIVRVILGNRIFVELHAAVRYVHPVKLRDPVLGVFGHLGGEIQRLAHLGRVDTEDVNLVHLVRNADHGAVRLFVRADHRNGGFAQLAAEHQLALFVECGDFGVRSGKGNALRIAVAAVGGGGGRILRVQIFAVFLARLARQHVDLMQTDQLYGGGFDVVMEEDLFIRSIALGGGCASPYRAAPGGERNERRNLYVVRIDFLPYVETEILRIFRRGDLGGFGCIEAAEGFLPAVCDIGDGGDRFALGKVTELRKADNGGIRFGNVMAARCRIPDPAFYRLGRGILELYGMRIVHLHVVEFHGPVGVHHGHLAVDLLPCERFGDIAGIRSRGVRPVVDGIGILRGIY